MLSWKEYTKAIDMWSIGCIFAELLGRKPLFPGKDYIHQLNLITDVIGTPDDEDIECIESEKVSIRHPNHSVLCQNQISFVGSGSRTLWSHYGHHI